MKNKNHNQRDSFFKPWSKQTVTLQKGALLYALCLLFIFGVSGLNAGYCPPLSYWDTQCSSWSYAGPCDDNYNCLAFAIGITDHWVWPWGGANPFEYQVTDYLATKGYYTTGTNPKVISYSPNGIYIVHFSHVTTIYSCKAKCGKAQLLDHYSWAPYYPNSVYGSQHTVYYDTKHLNVSISGPTQVNPNYWVTWCADVTKGTQPYSYTWYYSKPGGPLTQIGTSSCVSVLGEVTEDGYIDVAVTDSIGQIAGDFIYVTVETGGGGSRTRSLEPGDYKERIAASVFYLLAEARTKNINSSNPYDYIKSPYFRRIVEMGPIALMPIRKMILTSKENGLKEYILAIAAEEIARVDLKGDSFAWTTAIEFCRKWDDQMGKLPVLVARIIGSNQSIDSKNRALVELGIPAIPFIIDEINLGKNEFRSALNILTKGAGSLLEMENGENLEAWKKKKSGTIKILRNLAAAYCHSSQEAD